MGNRARTMTADAGMSQRLLGPMGLEGAPFSDGFFFFSAGEGDSYGGKVPVGPLLPARWGDSSLLPELPSCSRSVTNCYTDWGNESIHSRENTRQEGGGSVRDVSQHQGLPQNMPLFSLISLLTPPSNGGLAPRKTQPRNRLLACLGTLNRVTVKTKAISLGLGKRTVCFWVNKQTPIEIGLSLVTPSKPFWCVV